MEELCEDRQLVKERFINNGLERFGDEQFQTVVFVAHQFAVKWNLKGTFGTKSFFKAIRKRIIEVQNQKEQEIKHIEYITKKEAEELELEMQKHNLLRRYKKLAINELHINYLPEAISLVNKDDILMFLFDNFNVSLPKRTAKNELITETTKLLRKKRNMIKSFYCKFHEEISIHPIQVEEQLKISGYMRKKMMNSGELVVSTYDYLRKYGKNLNVPRYDRYLLLAEHYGTIVEAKESKKIIS